MTLGEHPSAGAADPGADPRLLIINADDFGLTPAVCRGILEAHRRGVVTSTSALVVAPAFDGHSAALRDAGLSVGGHLAAIGEDPPLLTAREIPSLVNATGRFPLRWQQFVRRAARGGIDTDDLRREFGAQIEKLSQAGLSPTHLDSHQNLHLWPQVATVLFEIAASRGIGAIRMVRSARWTPTAVGVRVLSSRLARRAGAAGLAFPEASTGLDEAGSIDVTRLLDTIDRLSATGAATAEMVTHLGQDPDPDRDRYDTRFRWSDELDAVCDPRAREAIDRAGFELGSFADLSARSAATAKGV